MPEMTGKPPLTKKEDIIQVPHVHKEYQWEEDGYIVTRGSAWSGPGCHDGCGVLMYVDKETGKLVKVEGDPENPYNQGRLCVRCLDVPEVVNSPDRLLHPMKRARDQRGNPDAWEEISWDEAFDIVVTKLNQIKEEYGPETVCFYQGTGRDISAYLTRICYAYGSSNYCYALDGQSCWIPRMAGGFATAGGFYVMDCSQQFPDRYDNPEWRPPQTILLWGNNPVVSNSDGFYGHWLTDCLKRGSNMVVIDPRVTWLATKAKIYMQIRPGTDAALALGMLNVIINEDLYDHDFVERWTYGFDELAKRVQEYPLDKVSEITGIPQEKIRDAARMFATEGPGAIQMGLAVDMTRVAIPCAHAICAIYQICGYVDVPGGMTPVVTFLLPDQSSGNEWVTEKAAAARLGKDKYPLLTYGVQLASTEEVLLAIETGKPYVPRAAWFMQTNILACTSAEPRRVKKAYEKLDFILANDLFMTPSIQALCDLVLPAQTYPERNGIVAGCGMQRAEAINKCPIKIGDTKSDPEIVLEIGRMLNPAAFPWDTVEEMFGAMCVEGTRDLTFDDLREVSPGFLPFTYRKYEKGMMRPDGQPGFMTATGRIELYSNFFQNLCHIDPMPYYEEPVPSPISTPDLAEKYPLILTTGARTWSMFHSEHRQIPRLRAMRPDPLSEVNPKTAEEFGVRDGDWVWVENHVGRAQRKVKVTPTISEGVVSTDHAWWRPEESPNNLYNVDELNINNLIVHNPGDSGFGANYKAMICTIYKLKEGERHA